MVDKLLEIDEEMYLPYVTGEDNQKVMYVKALYGTILGYVVDVTQTIILSCDAGW